VRPGRLRELCIVLRGQLRIATVGRILQRDSGRVGKLSVKEPGWSKLLSNPNYVPCP
jgi:hypothetical protein